MMVPEEVSLQSRFRYFEWGAILLAAIAQLIWLCAGVSFDNLVSVSFVLLAITSVVVFFTPRSKRGQFIQLLVELALIGSASALGGHHYYYLLLYVLAGKAALLLSRLPLCIFVGILIAVHIASGQFALYALHHIHLHHRPLPYFTRNFILEGESSVYFLIALIAVTFLGRILIADRNSHAAEEKLAKEIEQLAVNLERARIARDIHDGLGHSLNSAKIQLELALKRIEENNPDAVLKLLSQCQEAIGSSLQEVRRVVRTEKSEDIDLQKTVTQLVDQIKQQSNLSFTLKLDDIKLSPGSQHQVFSIIQECLNNIRKHASASHVEIALNSDGSQANLRVQDNGIGFDAGAAHSGYGLKGLRERAELLGTNIKIYSAAGKGTTILVSFSLAAEQSATQRMSRAIKIG